MPLTMLAESASFNISTALESVQSVFTTLLNIVKGEPILAAAFVASVLVPVAWGIVKRVKHA